MSHRFTSVCGVLIAVFLPAIAVAQMVTETVSFQQGANYTGTTNTPYGGTVNVIISDNPTYDPAAPVGPVPVVDGSTVNRLYVDAYGTDSAGQQTSWRRDVLLRFDSIIGDVTGLVPPNATVLSARLQLFTTTTANDQSPGPIGVAKLLKPFDTTTTTFNDPFGDNGPDFAGGDYDRWIGGYEGCAQGIVQVTEVTPVVQAWVNGEPNHGFILRINGSNAWGFGSSANGTQVRRPKLIVEFTRVRSRYLVIQQDVNGYTGTSMLRLQASTLADPTGTTTLGTAIAGGAYLDGGEDLAVGLLKFDDVFGTGPNQVPPDLSILRAYVALSTTGSGNAPSRGRYDFHRLLIDVDWAGDGGEPFLWSEFANADGPTLADNEIGPVLASTEGMLWNARPWVDITSTVMAWQGGETNYGLIVKPGTSDNGDGVTPPAPTTDGWEIDWLGTDPTRHPQLILVVPSKGADFDRNGYVDALDLENHLIPCASGPSVPCASSCSYVDLDEDGDVDMADFSEWQLCFSGTLPASSECQ
jgi:hypothetical protein